MIDTPMPDWVLIEAAKQCGWTPTLGTEIHKVHKRDDAFRALCDMILNHEEPPVDRKLLCAREAAAERYNVLQSQSHAERAREGIYDGSLHIKVSLRAIELYEQGFGA